MVLERLGKRFQPVAALYIVHGRTSFGLSWWRGRGCRRSRRVRALPFAAQQVELRLEHGRVQHHAQLLQGASLLLDFPADLFFGLVPLRQVGALASLELADDADALPRIFLCLREPPRAWSRNFGEMPGSSRWSPPIWPLARYCFQPAMARLISSRARRNALSRIAVTSASTALA
ncbi:hypothetical protein ACTMU2_32375 [Cupriavidus basilensis]